MDVSGETADLLIREGVQATEGALKLTGACLKNVTALLSSLAYWRFWSESAATASTKKETSMA